MPQGLKARFAAPDVRAEALTYRSQFSIRSLQQDLDLALPTCLRALCDAAQARSKRNESLLGLGSNLARPRADL